MKSHDVVITGIGLVSCLGEGVDTHWQAFRTPQLPPPVNTEAFPPYPVHMAQEMDLNLQIPKRGDQRQMEAWQRLGVYTAGLALDDAGLKTDEAMCASMDMIVAAAGGERDIEVDETIMAGADAAADFGIFLNERLTNDLRPTLFLAQLSNLLAGNISIVHKVTGSSRTMMGEEGAGVSALATATARLRSGQSSHMLIGAALHSEAPDKLLIYETGQMLHQGPWQPVWSRTGPGGGMIAGTGSAFLVLETREHAEARGRKPYAVIEQVVSGRAKRNGDALRDGLAALASEAGLDTPHLVISGATGLHDATAAEKDALSSHALRGYQSLTGHLREAQLLFGVALAALSVANGEAPPPISDGEAAFDAAPERVAATSVATTRGEGIAILTKA
jgi:3-oxoacyl-[acyl-carrier-protein] synthase II